MHWSLGNNGSYTFEKLGYMRSSKKTRKEITQSIEKKARAFRLQEKKLKAIMYIEQNNL